MGRGARRRRVRGVRGGRGFRQRDGGALSRLDSGAGRQLGRDGRLRAVSGPRARRAAAAQTNGNRGVKTMAAALTLALLVLLSGLPAQLRAATAYVSDELVLGVYAEQNGQGNRLTTLHSGTSVETLAQSGEFTQVRLSDGTLGWVKSAF